MIEITKDFHTHTVHSHGTGTVEENVQAAIAKGLSAIAISDHGFSHLFYGIRDIDAYLRDIENMKKKYAGQIEVLSNVELNIISLDGKLDLPVGYENAFDLLMFGYHKMSGYKGLKDKLDFMLPKRHNKSTADKFTDAYIAAIHRYKIDMISHPGYGVPLDKTRLAQAAASTGTALEINAKHPEFSVEELKLCADTGVRFVIGSDAHSPGRVGDFAVALAKAEQAGLTPQQIINAQYEANNTKH